MPRGNLRVAVLGAGIMGSSIALLLARKGVRVTLVDRAPAPMARASRWNEGKIHLGFLYARDRSLNTARRILPGGLVFKALVEEMLDGSIDDALSNADDIFLNHRDSLVGPADASDYVSSVSGLIEEHPDCRLYRSTTTETRARVMSGAELARVTSSDKVVSGFYIPERSVQTNLIADRFVAAIDAHPLIEKALMTQVTGATEHAGGWQIISTPQIDGRFDAVINALWENRNVLDRTLSDDEAGTLSYRYRLSVFLRTGSACDHTGALITTGPFGEIKNYNGRDFYLSWYPAGLITDCDTPDDTIAERISDTSRNEVLRRTVDELSPYFGYVRGLVQQAEHIKVEGGWVVAKGYGTIADPSSPLHRRDDFGIARRGSYFSVDTGKYSTAPWIAHKVVGAIVG